jgi:hypothetical protein
MNESSADIIEDLGVVSPDNPWPWVVPLFALLICGALCGGFLWFHLRRKPAASPLDVPTPGKTAIEQLAAIQHLIDQGRVREFVFEASSILRAYIEFRFALSAPRLSTEEFLREAKQCQKLDAAWCSKLAEFLLRCDRVKFADDDLGTSQMKGLFQSAENFVQETAFTASSEGPR